MLTATQKMAIVRTLATMTGQQLIAKLRFNLAETFSAEMEAFILRIDAEYKGKRDGFCPKRILAMAK